MGLARAFERRNAFPSTTPGGVRFTRPPPPPRASATPKAALPAPTSPPSQSPAPPTLRPKPTFGARFTRLTPEEMAKHREEGHCFNCPAKFSREHLKE